MEHVEVAANGGQDGTYSHSRRVAWEKRYRVRISWVWTVHLILAGAVPGYALSIALEVTHGPLNWRLLVQYIDTN